jgi:hypothetical protein
VRAGGRESTIKEIGCAQIDPKDDRLAGGLTVGPILPGGVRADSFQKPVAIALPGKLAPRLETKIRSIGAVTRQAVEFNPERSDSRVVFVHLGDGRPKLCGLNKIAADQNGANDQADDDHHYGHLDQSKAAHWCFLCIFVPLRHLVVYE